MPIFYSFFSFFSNLANAFFSFRSLFSLSSLCSFSLISFLQCSQRIVSPLISCANVAWLVLLQAVQSILTLVLFISVFIFVNGYLIMASKIMSWIYRT